MVARILISPKVSELVDDEMARDMADKIPELMKQPSQDLELGYGTVQAWGVELLDERDQNRSYRVAFILEESDDPTPVWILTIAAMEERMQLEAPPARRGTLKGWKIVEME